MSEYSFLRTLITEESNSTKKEKKPEKVFIETDPSEAFPENTVSALRKRINKNARDLELEWRSPIELVNSSFEELEVPIPLAYQTKRWIQYKELLSDGIQSLVKSRGLKGSWSKKY